MKKVFVKYRNMTKPMKASLWFIICGFLQKGISFLSTPIFSRLLTTEEYGIVSVFQTWNSIVVIIATLNLAAGVYLRGLIKFEDERDMFTASLQSLFVVCAVIVFFIYIIFRQYLNLLFSLPTCYVCAMFLDIMACTAFQFWSARQRVEFRYKNLVIITLLNASLKPLMGITAITIYDNNVAAEIYTIVIADVITFGYFLLTIFVHQGKKIYTKYWRYSLSYNIPLVPHYLSQIVLNQSDRVMINALIGTSEAGIYSLAYNAAAVMTMFNQSILNSYNPWMYQNIKDKNYNRIGKYSLYLLGFIACINLALIAFAPEAIAILAPPTYYQAIWVVPPVAMSVYFMFMYNLYANFEFYYEKTRYMMMASVLGAILNITLNYIFINKYGFLAAGYTTLVCYLCYCIFHYIVMTQILNRELPETKIYNIKAVGIISFTFVVAGFIFMALYTHTIFRYVLIFVILAIQFMFRNKIKNIINNVVRAAKSA